MKFTILGGDDRMVRLVRLLRDDGHEVAPYALEKTLVCSSEPDFEGTDCILLPLPCAKDEALFAPESESEHCLATLLSHAPRGTPVLAGKATGELNTLCAQLGLPLTDYFLREDFTLRNALLTAEGAIELMLRHSPRSIWGSRVLIYGFGRIGSALARRLTALGAHVTVAARRPDAQIMAKDFGCTAMDFTAPPPEADFVLNTVPAPHLKASDFPGAVCIELASPPYGFEAETLGSTAILGSALPGKTAPASAAEAIRDTIYNILEVSSCPHFA